MQRSAVSIPSNIAEGAARKSKAEFLQFLSMGSGKGYERGDKMNNLKQFYEQDALREIPESTRRIEELRYRMLISKVPKGSKMVLDVGCGNGELMCMLGEKGHKCVALDLSENRLGKFKDRARKLGLVQMQGDATNIPLQNSSMDVILCSEVLEHIKDYDNVLKEMNRILKPHGRIIVSVPYNEELMEIVCPHCGKRFVPYGHLHSFDKNKLFSSMNRCGFNVRYSHVGPLSISKFIYRRIRINMPLIFFIDRLSRYLKVGGAGQWLMATGTK